MNISKEYSFEASHVLPEHVGKCSKLHGHSYRVRVTVEGLVKHNNFVLDYHDLDTVMKPIIERLDHEHLNLLVTFPSAENIATYIASFVKKRLTDFDHVIITVAETEKTTATWDSNDTEDLARVVMESGNWQAPVVEYTPPNDIEGCSDSFYKLLDAADDALKKYQTCRLAAAMCRRKYLQLAAEHEGKMDLPETKNQ